MTAAPRANIGEVPRQLGATFPKFTRQPSRTFSHAYFQVFINTYTFSRNSRLGVCNQTLIVSVASVFKQKHVHFPFSVIIYLRPGTLSCSQRHVYKVQCLVKHDDIFQALSAGQPFGMVETSNYPHIPTRKGAELGGRHSTTLLLSR